MQPSFIVQRAYLDRDAASFELRIPGETLSLLVHLRGRKLALGVLPGKHRLQEARKLGWLEPAAVLGSEPLGAALRLLRDGRALRLAAQGGALRLGPCPDELLDAPIEPLPLDALRENGERLQRELLGSRREQQVRAIDARLQKAAQRLDRRAEHIQGDLDKLAQMQAKAQLAPLFLAAAKAAPRGARALEATDWSTGEPVAVQFPLDPARSAQEQLEALFRRAKRAKHGAEIAEERWFAATDKAALLRALRDELRQSEAQRLTPHEADSRPEPLDLAALVQRARAIAPRDFSAEVPTSAKVSQSRALPYNEFVTERGEPIWVGRGAEHNDALTFHLAKPHHLWLHTKDWPGTHVIIPLDKGEQASPERLLDAASLAAHFSEARGERVVGIQIAERRHLRKPKGAPRGLAVVHRERVMELRADPERLDRLLRSAGE